MLRHAHPAFPSDVFLCLEAAGATVTVADVASGREDTSASLSHWLAQDMAGKIVTKIGMRKTNDIFRLGFFFFTF